MVPDDMMASTITAYYPFGLSKKKYFQFNASNSESLDNHSNDDWDSSGLISSLTSPVMFINDTSETEKEQYILPALDKQSIFGKISNSFGFVIRYLR